MATGGEGAEEAAAKMAELEVGGGDGGEAGKGAAEAAGSGIDAVEKATNAKALEQQRSELLRAVYGIKKDTDEDKAHKFWSSQPVPKPGQIVVDDAAKAEDGMLTLGPIDNKTVAEVRTEPYNLPKGFSWCSIDVSDDEQLKEAYTLLTENYVEDDDGMFRFDYSPEFLRWALMPPGFRLDWHVGVRQESNNRLLAMITGVPATTRVHGTAVRMAEINFLCVHQKLRHKRVAPVLIKEVTRRVNLTDAWQAVYTAGVKIPKPFGVAQYFHRSINPKKLIKVGFSQLHGRLTMASTIRLYKLPEAPKQTGIRAMEKGDVPGVRTLLNKYLSQFKVWIEFDDEEVAHWLLPRDNVIYSYVITDAEGKVTDFCSFYNLPSSVLHSKEYPMLKAAYSFYNVATSVTLKELMQDALIFARDNDFDVFNALNIMENKTFLKDLKFGEGDGHLHYYLFNYAVPEMEPSDIGVVLL